MATTIKTINSKHSLKFTRQHKQKTAPVFILLHFFFLLRPIWNISSGKKKNRTKKKKKENSLICRTIWCRLKCVFIKNLNEHASALHTMCVAYSAFIYVNLLYCSVFCVCVCGFRFFIHCCYCCLVNRSALVLHTLHKYGDYLERAPSDLKVKSKAKLLTINTKLYQQLQKRDRLKWQTCIKLFNRMEYFHCPWCLCQVRLFLFYA